MRRLFLVLPILFGAATRVEAGELRAGVAAVNITPPDGTPLAGYYSPRGATGVLDNLYSKALVLEQDGTRAALVVCDLVTLPRRVVVDARKQIEKQTGIPAAQVMVSATHTHTGPVLRRDSPRDSIDGSNSDLAQRYTDNLPDLIARSVAEANGRLTPVRLRAALGKEDNLSFNRRFLMRDGTVSWNPRKQHPDIVKPAGPIDPDVGVLSFDTPKGAPLAMYVNYAMHPDTVGGTAISADFPGVLARLLAECRGPGLTTLFANGCCGNLNHRNIQWTDPQKGPHEAHRLGTILAGAVCRATPSLAPTKGQGLKVKQELVQLPLAPITPEDVAKAKDVIQRFNEPKTAFLDKVKAYQVLDVAARNGQPWEVEVQVVSFGDDVAWVSLPGEIFVELGLAIKKASSFRYTLIAELANGSIGYIPDAPAYPQGNYEVVSARCAAGSGEKLVETAIRLMKDLHVTK
jgi:hypothetical protein